MMYRRETNYGIDYDDDAFTSISPFYADSIYETEGRFDAFTDLTAGNNHVPSRLEDLYQSSTVHPTFENYLVTRRVPEFYGETTNSNEYYWKEPALNESCHHREVTPSKNYNNPAPFYSETTNQAVYQPHQPAVLRPESSRGTGEDKHHTVPFYGETSNRATYTPKERSNIPMETRTTQQEDFDEKTTRRCPAEVVLNNRRKIRGKVVKGHFFPQLSE
ncbi:hypothetical protein QR680_017047 [Steinernema hermaphroditum]|uniref:Uncharacterized protein n=1 Tax=Steinernema hermaphroditum TaxID=289476 RepID=A0AA39HD43_9BILA|nr:hypothetical protein QR680_017047 [Steinernema hermaphroditum]